MGVSCEIENSKFELEEASGRGRERRGRKKSGETVLSREKRTP